MKAVRGEADPPCTLAKSLQNAELMDECYRQAGLLPRGMHEGVIKEIKES